MDEVAARDLRKESVWRRRLSHQAEGRQSVRSWCRQHQITEVASRAHARRKFYDSRGSDLAASTDELAHNQLLYNVENQVKQQAKQAAMSRLSHRVSAHKSDRRLHDWLVENLLRLREESSGPRLADFKAWLEYPQAERGGPELSMSPLGQVIQYALNQGEAFSGYTTDGRLAIDNNASENALRRVAIGRKNWLFAGSDNGGRTAATMFNLIATRQSLQIVPMACLRNVLTRIAAIPFNQLADLLPDRWQPATAN